MASDNATPTHVPPDWRTVRPSPRPLTRLITCRQEGHDRSEWKPIVRLGEVRGRVKYCERCGKRLTSDYFGSDPEASFVFEDRSWYPEALSCYDESADQVDCMACGRTFGLNSLHASARITEIDSRSNHRADRDHEEHSGRFCSSCWAQLRELLGLPTVGDPDGA